MLGPRIGGQSCGVSRALTAPGGRVVGRGAVPGALCCWKDFNSSLSRARAHGENGPLLPCTEAGTALHVSQSAWLHAALKALALRAIPLWFLGVRRTPVRVSPVLWKKLAILNCRVSSLLGGGGY